MHRAEFNLLILQNSGLIEQCADAGSLKIRARLMVEANQGWFFKDSRLIVTAINCFGDCVLYSKAIFIFLAHSLQDSKINENCCLFVFKKLDTRHYSLETRHRKINNCSLCVFEKRFSISIFLFRQTTISS